MTSPSPTSPIPGQSSRAGRAFVWKGIQLVGVKALFLVRLLILARLLVPDDFGLVAVALIPIGVLLNLTDLGLIPALVQLREVEGRHYDSAWTTGLLRAAAIATVVILTAPWVAELSGDARATPLIRLLALHPLLEALGSIKIAALIRDLDFRSLALIRLSQALVNTVVSVILAPTLGVWALVIGTLASSAAYAATSYLLAPYLPRLEMDRAAGASLIRFGRWILVTSILAVLSTAVLKMLISRRLGVAELGLYFLAARLAFLPAEIAGEITGAVAFPFFAGIRSNPGEAARVFRGILTSLLAILTPITLLIIVLAPLLQQYVLGPNWAGTVPAIRVLALAALLGTLGEVAIPVFQGLGEPRRQTAVEAVQAVVLIGMAWWLTGELGLLGAALAWLPAIGVAQILCALFLRYLLPRPFAGVKGRLSAIALTSGAGALAAAALSLTWPTGVGFVAAGLVGGSLTLALLWLADQRFGLLLAQDLTRFYPGLAGWLPGSSAGG